jgi:hypothetical protein
MMGTLVGRSVMGLGFCLLSLVATDLATEDGACVSELDCQLNGACVEGRCACDTAWSGGAKNCSVLSLLPATVPSLQGFPANGLAANWSTWGGNALFRSIGALSACVLRSALHRV